MTLSSLILSRDPQTLGVVRPVLTGMNMAVEVADSHNAATAITQRRFDAIIIDIDDYPEGASLLKSIRASDSNRGSMTFALTNQKTTAGDAFGLGANFVLEKPITQESATRHLRAAYGPVVAERRRYFRHKVQIPVRLRLESGVELHATTTNLSEGGMAVELPKPVSKLSSMECRFALPGTSKMIELRGSLAWSDAKSHAGIRFTRLNPEHIAQLEQWLRAQS